MLYKTLRRRIEMDNSRKTIIIVDDNLTNLTVGKNMLKTFYHVIPVASAKEMFETLEEIVPSLILLDIEMPEMDGYEAIQKLKADERFAEIPIIFLTAKDDADSELEGLDLGAADYITKPFSAPLLLKRIDKELQIVGHQKELMVKEAELLTALETSEAQVNEKEGEVFRLQNAILTNVADFVEMRDDCTGGHIQRTRKYLQIMIDEMISSGVYTEEVKEWNMDEVLSSAKLHDVGKITISDNILNKPGKLDTDEFETMKSHVFAGVDAIEKIMKDTHETGYMQHALNIIGTHHEKWDGRGYPIGLSGKSIPLEGRLMAIGDVYDALVSKRPYKKPMPHEKACEIIEEGSGTHFDPSLVAVFVKVKDQFGEVSQA